MAVRRAVQAFFDSVDGLNPTIDLIFAGATLAAFAARSLARQRFKLAPAGKRRTRREAARLGSA